MASNAQMTGMRDVYLVAAELSRLGFIVSPTSRSAAGADLLVTDQKYQNAFSVQVKTNAKTFHFWLIGKKAQETVSESHIYVLVNIRQKKGGEEIEYYVVPSKILVKNAIHDGNWPNMPMSAVKNLQNKWDVFGAPI
ncbi:hypothetical protein VN23_11040 [Janthinobacterium sp. B9-8]|nr:hypothetical protein VN23_11040 [Janthinobacterium sp. B9-8]